MSTAPSAGRLRAAVLLVCLGLSLSAAPAAAATPDPAEVTARGAVLWVPQEDRVLFDKEATAGRPMASTTKIMTLLLALEAGHEDDLVTVSAGAAALGEATLDLRAGQVIPMRSLVAGLLLRSGNDAARAVAEHVSGSEAAFVARMNARAAELGLDQTHFVNASGLTSDLAHRAAPLDLARLGAVAMEHPVFAEYAGTARASVPGLAPMTSRNELLGTYPGADGIKTGYTRLAGLTLVASATRGDRTLYAVVLGSEDSFGDASALLDHGFIDFRRVAVLPAGAPVLEYRWADAHVGVRAAEPLVATVPRAAEAVWRTTLDPALRRPVEAGQPVGRAVLLLDGEPAAEVDLVADSSVAARAGTRPPAAQVGAAVQEALRAFALSQEVDRAA